MLTLGLCDPGEVCGFVNLTNLERCKTRLNLWIFLYNDHLKPHLFFMDEYFFPYVSLANWKLLPCVRNISTSQNLGWYKWLPCISRTETIFSFSLVCVSFPLSPPVSDCVYLVFTPSSGFNPQLSWDYFSSFPSLLHFLQPLNTVQNPMMFEFTLNFWTHHVWVDLKFGKIRL